MDLRGGRIRLRLGAYGRLNTGPLRHSQSADRQDGISPKGHEVKILAMGRGVPRLQVRLLGCYVLIPSFLALLSILRGSVLAPSLPYWDRVLLFIPPAISGWIVAGVLIGGLIELTGARSLPATIGATAIGAVLTATFNYYSLSLYFYFMRGRWPWLAPLYKGNLPQFNDALPKFLIGPHAIYLYVTIAMTYAGYRALVPGARYLGDGGHATVEAARELNSIREESQPAPIDRALKPPNKIDTRTPAFIRRLAPHLGTELILLSAEEHYIRIVTRLGSALVLYRFSDAIEELTRFDGDRVHRSFWIAWCEVVKIQRQGRTYRLKMSSGEYVPVSRSQTGVVLRRLSQYNVDGHMGPPSVAWISAGNRSTR